MARRVNIAAGPGAPFFAIFVGIFDLWVFHSVTSCWPPAC